MVIKLCPCIIQYSYFGCVEIIMTRDRSSVDVCPRAEKIQKEVLVVWSPSGVFSEQFPENHSVVGLLWPRFFI